MTTINTTDDLLRSARENPEFREAFRREVLTEELLDMPDRLKTLTATVEAQTHTIGSLLEVVEANGQRMDHIDSSIIALAEAARGRFDVVDQKLGDIETTGKEAGRQLNALRTTVNGLRGDSLEERLTNRIPPLVSRAFGVRRPYPIWKHGFLPTDDRILEFRQKLESATDEGKLSDADELRLTVTDLIVRTQRKTDRSTLWFVIEASGVIDHEDITRARHSALALVRVYEQDVIGLVYGYEISQQDRRLAEHLNVSVFLDPDRR